MNEVLTEKEFLALPPNYYAYEESYFDNSEKCLEHLKNVCRYQADYVKQLKGNYWGKTTKGFIMEINICRLQPQIPIVDTDTLLESLLEDIEYRTDFFLYSEDHPLIKWMEQYTQLTEDYALVKKSLGQFLISLSKIKFPVITEESLSLMIDCSE